MTKQRITVVGIIIVAIALGRFLLNRIDRDYTNPESIYDVMYLTDSTAVHIEPNDSTEILYILFYGDSVLVRDYNATWKELQSGGYLPSVFLADDKL